ncbi:hypothetical protein D5086_011690 [Populus alba]|uniref:Uncharacterized protein n=1 Tax=Populus alba TaxID=43335 RepID=A0ACC4CE14_POPAL
MSSPTTPRQKPDLKDHQSSPENNLPPSSETHSSFPNTTLEVPKGLIHRNLQQSFLLLHRIGGGLSKEVDVEALIAISVGFPVDSLTEEETEANVVSMIGGREQANYIAAIEEAQVKLNDGVERGNAVVVGAGLFGLVAARQSMAMGFKFFVLEGNARPGGRVKTMKRKGEGVVAVADVGASVLTGINGNPHGVLARKMGLHLHKKGLQETIMILAGSVGDGRVFFAREATSEQNPATMHGAFLSWMMKAASMLRVASRRPLAVIDKANNGLEEIDDLNELYDTSNLTFGSLSIFFNPRKQAAVELSELQDDGNVGSKGLSSAGGESLVTYIKEA